jgi:hypothetical protein
MFAWLTFTFAILTQRNFTFIIQIAGCNVGTRTNSVEAYSMSEEQRKPQSYKLIVNKDEKDWPERHINGLQILKLAGSPPDWVVNQLVPGAGEDPEIGPEESVDLDVQADPKGIKRFQTRKPKTNPGTVR